MRSISAGNLTQDQRNIIDLPSILGVHEGGKSSADAGNQLLKRRPTAGAVVCNGWR
jgi:hypothetical protein